jgi:hypothetical protein
MSDKPLARELPIDRVRARLEALVMANAAPRCGARSKRGGEQDEKTASRSLWGNSGMREWRHLNLYESLP